MSSRLLSNEYYFENSAGIILSPEGREVIEEEIVKQSPKCNVCGQPLELITMMEGDFLICPGNMYKHAKHKWTITHDPAFKNPPALVHRGEEIKNGT